MCGPEVQLGDSKLMHGMGGSLVSQTPPGARRMERPRRMGAKSGNRAENLSYLGIQEGNLGSD
jgi:hypothetical protein